MYFPARDGTASAAPSAARPGLGACAGKDQTLFEKAQTERSDAQRGRSPAQGLGIHTTSWRLAPANGPCWDVGRGQGLHPAPAVPSDSPSVTPAANGQTGPRWEGLGESSAALEALVPLDAASWCLDGRAECVRTRGAAARAWGTEGGIGGDGARSPGPSGAAATPGLRACGSSLSPVGWETGNTAVQAALASFFSRQPPPPWKLLAVLCS